MKRCCKETFKTHLTVGQFLLFFHTCFLFISWIHYTLILFLIISQMTKLKKMMSHNYFSRYFTTINMGLASLFKVWTKEIEKKLSLINLYGYNSVFCFPFEFSLRFASSSKSLKCILIKELQILCLYQKKNRIHRLPFNHLCQL